MRVSANHLEVCLRFSTSGGPSGKEIATQRQAVAFGQRTEHFSEYTCAVPALATRYAFQANR